MFEFCPVISTVFSTVISFSLQNLSLLILIFSEKIKKERTFRENPLKCLNNDKLLPAGEFSPFHE